MGRFPLLAPLVAMVWARLLTIVLHIPNATVLAITLGLCVWLIYSIDSFLDTVRHHPRNNHRNLPLFAGWALVALLNGYLTWAYLDPLVVLAATPVLAAVLVYFLQVHWLARKRPSSWPREIVVGILFASGICLPIAALTDQWRRMLLLYPLLASLMTLNCCGVKTWPFANRYPQNALSRWIGKHLRSLSFLLALLALALHLTVGGPALNAIALSGVLLAFLSAFAKTWPPKVWSRAADMALCSPLLLPLFWR